MDVVPTENVVWLSVFGFGLKLSGLILGPSRVFHSWRGKF